MNMKSSSSKFPYNFSKASEMKSISSSKDFAAFGILICIICGFFTFEIGLSSFIVRKGDLSRESSPAENEKVKSNSSLTGILKISSVEEGSRLGDICESDWVLFAEENIKICKASSAYCKKKGFDVENCILMQSKYHNNTFVSSLLTVVTRILGFFRSDIFRLCLT